MLLTLASGNSGASTEKVPSAAAAAASDGKCVAPALTSFMFALLKL